MIEVLYEKLKNSISKHWLPHKFTCLTDTEKDYDSWFLFELILLILSLFEKVGQCLYFDLDIETNYNIDFLAFNSEDFDKLILINSINWKGKSDDRFKFRNNTLINSSIMRCDLNILKSLWKRFIFKIIHRYW